ncbi:MAG: L,D-transpeptidase family protein [Sphingomicrobium sp.]
MKRLRNLCTGETPVHFCQRVSGAALSVLLVAAPMSSAHAAAGPAPAVSRPASQTVGDFYSARNGAPLWLATSAGDAAEQLVSLLGTASLDGLNPDKYHVASLQHALEAARGGQKKDVDAADRALSEAFVAYVSDLRRDPGLGILYVDAALRPAPPSALAALLGAANAPSLSAYVRDLGWMNPMYGELRHALANHGYASDHERQLLSVNLERARTLPAGKQRYILVNAAQQRLYTYENGKQADSMVVVVGKPKYPTPMITAYVRFASLNPYWFVPPDLAAERIAPKVLKQGMRYLDDLGYQVLSDWSPDAQIIDPTTVDWKAVVAGKTEVFMRQLPGSHNSMGRMKFMFPNAAGVYLHDNPERELFTEASRLYSGGCVRLEDAARLGRWLFGYDLQWEGAGTEEMVPLKTPVPVYITYLTAMPDANGSSIAYFDDVYGRDAERLATLQSSAGTVASASR